MVIFWAPPFPNSKLPADVVHVKTVRHEKWLQTGLWSARTWAATCYKWRVTELEKHLCALSCAHCCCKEAWLIVKKMCFLSWTEFFFVFCVASEGVATLLHWETVMAHRNWPFFCHVGHLSCDSSWGTAPPCGQKSYCTETGHGLYWQREAALVPLLLWLTVLIGEGLWRTQCLSSAKHFHMEQYICI